MITWALDSYLLHTYPTPRLITWALDSYPIPRLHSPAAWE